MDFGARFSVNAYAPHPAYFWSGGGEAGFVDVDGALQVRAVEVSVAAVGIAKVRSPEVCAFDVAEAELGICEIGPAFA